MLEVHPLQSRTCDHWPTASRCITRLEQQDTTLQSTKASSIWAVLVTDGISKKPSTGFAPKDVICAWQTTFFGHFQGPLQSSVSGSSGCRT